MRARRGGGGIAPIAAAAIALCVLWSCCGYDGPKIEVGELEAAMGRGDRAVHVLDVRPAALYRRGHLPGAVSFPLETLEGRLDEVRALKGDVYVICTCGRKALVAAKDLQAQGIAAIFVVGGVKAWTAAGYPLEGEEKGGQE